MGVQSYNMGCSSTFQGRNLESSVDHCILFPAGSKLPNILTFVPPVTDWIRDNAETGMFCSKETVEDSQGEGKKNLTFTEEL